jgi:hypothetical protein
MPKKQPEPILFEYLPDFRVTKTKVSFKGSLYSSEELLSFRDEAPPPRKRQAILLCTLLLVGSGFAWETDQTEVIPFIILLMVAIIFWARTNDTRRTITLVTNAGKQDAFITRDSHLADGISRSLRLVFAFKRSTTARKTNRTRPAPPRQTTKSTPADDVRAPPAPPQLPSNKDLPRKKAARDNTRPTPTAAPPPVRVVSAPMYEGPDLDDLPPLAPTPDPQKHTKTTPKVDSQRNIPRVSALLTLDDFDQEEGLEEMTG